MNTCPYPGCERTASGYCSTHLAWLDHLEDR